MKLLISILMTVLFCITASAQQGILRRTSAGSSKTIVVSGKDVGRYEILVFSGVAVRLDTFTGRTYSSDSSSSSGSSSRVWSPAFMQGKELPDESLNSKPKYRVYAGGTGRTGDSLAFYLLNTETGQTWFSKVSYRGLIQWQDMVGG